MDTFGLKAFWTLAVEGNFLDTLPGNLFQSTLRLLSDSVALRILLNS